MLENASEMKETWMQDTAHNQQPERDTLRETEMHEASEHPVAQTYTVMLPVDADKMRVARYEWAHRSQDRHAWYLGKGPHDINVNIPDEDTISQELYVSVGAARLPTLYLLMRFGGSIFGGPRPRHS